ncbi:MAG: hypothetical protein IEMM0003_0664 [bacterium]|nr:MAG: hypothetical protein IEMM0003_0664 [bacterium]
MNIKKILVGIIASMAVVVYATTFAYAKKSVTPSSLKGATIVNAKWVKANKNKIQAYDARMKAEYVDAHIPGAISVWYHEKSKKSVNFDGSKDRFDLSKFPSNKNTPEIVYCNGPRCWKSYKAAVTLIRAGYKYVYWFRGGLPAWIKAGYPTE